MNKAGKTKFHLLCAFLQADQGKLRSLIVLNRFGSGY